MNPFPFGDYPVTASQEPYNQNWYYPTDSNLQNQAPAVYPEQHPHHHQQQHHQNQHQGPPHPTWIGPGAPSTGAPMWPQTDQSQRAMSAHQRSLAPPRPEMSRHNSITSEALSSAASLVEESANNFPFAQHPERSPGPLAASSTSLSDSFSSPPPPGSRMLEAASGSISSSAGPSEHHHSEIPPKRTRGRPRKIRPEAEPKPPKVSRRQPHNMVERKYREGLNKEMERLRGAIPNLEGALGAAVGSKASKATVLQSAVEEIETLRKEKEKLEDELLRSRNDLDQNKKVRETLEQKVVHLEEEIISLRRGYGGGRGGLGGSSR